MKHRFACVALCLLFTSAANAEEPKVDDAVKELSR